MQDPSGAPPLRSLAASCSRLLSDRRLRPHLNQAVKCPRCDSLNTKFCYYNNYNLSQPRHFCKGCRRYWTKGGVLRNVPEGGGCRKAKRSKQKNSVEEKTKKESSTGGKTSSHSSSESSSLTATEASSTSNSVAENPVQPPVINPQPVPLMFDPILTFLPETRMFASPNAANTSLLDSVGMINFSTDSLNSGSIFAETTSFTSLMTGNSIPTISSGMGTSGSLAFNFSDIPLKFPSSSRMVDHLHSSAVPTSMTEIVSSINDLPSPLQQQSNMSNGEITTPLEWESSVDRHNVFDLPPTVDPSYWMQNQWTTDEDHPPLYLP